MPLLGSSLPQVRKSDGAEWPFDRRMNVFGWKWSRVNPSPSQPA
jgi:hypothetical protein